MPPACMSCPETGFMRTLTSPSWRGKPFQMASGHRSPSGSAANWASTYGWVGALRSVRTSHWGARPRLVIVMVQPGGLLPNGALSKLTIRNVEADSPNATNPRNNFILASGECTASLTLDSVVAQEAFKVG